jgi:CheY-like chemotaxis protein
VSSDPGPIRILSVDDHPLIRQGIAGLVATQADMNLIAQAANGREAIQQFHRHRPDITLMDLQMPEMSGLDAIIAIRGEFPEARIIVLTTYAGDVQALRALQAGAQIGFGADAASQRHPMGRRRRLDHQGMIGKVRSADRVFRREADLDEPVAPGNLTFVMRQGPARNGARPESCREPFWCSCRPSASM